MCFVDFVVLVVLCVYCLCVGVGDGRVVVCVVLGGDVGVVLGFCVLLFVWCGWC